MIKSPVTAYLSRLALPVSSGKAVLRMIAIGVPLWLGACVSTPFYDYPPQMPVVLSPESGAILQAAVPVEFVWRRTDETESYEFHIFNASNTDISQYMKTGLYPDSVCVENLCSINLYLSLPESDHHAWRVRASNNAGKSAWTRNLFSFSPGTAQ